MFKGLVGSVLALLSIEIPGERGWTKPKVHCGLHESVHSTMCGVTRCKQPDAFETGDARCAQQEGEGSCSVSAYVREKVLCPFKDVVSCLDDFLSSTETDTHMKPRSRKEVHTCTQKTTATAHSTSHQPVRVPIVTQRSTAQHVSRGTLNNDVVSLRLPDRPSFL